MHTSDEKEMIESLQLHAREQEQESESERERARAIERKCERARESVWERARHTHVWKTPRVWAMALVIATLWVVSDMLRLTVLLASLSYVAWLKQRERERKRTKTRINYKRGSSYRVSDKRERGGDVGERNFFQEAAEWRMNRESYIFTAKIHREYVFWCRFLFYLPHQFWWILKLLSRASSHFIQNLVQINIRHEIFTYNLSFSTADL